jgi:hypothetical protein
MPRDIERSRMFKRISHAEGVKDDDEILFSTPFNYLFPDAARSPACLLPVTEATHAGLRALGAAMADTGSPGDPQAAQDSPIDAAFTYLGQFIDHDLTARTDRDGVVSGMGRGNPIVPVAPDDVARTLRNGRRPQLDLDSVFGDGPGLAGSVKAARTQSHALYDDDFRLITSPVRFDLKRSRATVVDEDGSHDSFPALVADGRNDENLNVSQLHTAFLHFYNKVYDAQTGLAGARQKHIRARQLVRWAYQYVVVHEYLPTVADPHVVADTLANGPRFYGAPAGLGGAFMPLEFSVAGFRFAHSMIRPFYVLSASSGPIKLSRNPDLAEDQDPNAIFLLGVSGAPANFEADHQLKAKLVIEWGRYVGSSAQKARKIDTKIAHDLFTLPFRPDDPVLSHLARSNLFRGYSLSIPTGQAIADACGVEALTARELLDGEDTDIADALKAGYFHRRTPLWYYVLREAAVQQGGARLGELGSRLVAETVVGLVKGDPNSYLNNRHDPAVRHNGIDVRPGAGGLIQSLRDLLVFAGAGGL